MLSTSWFSAKMTPGSLLLIPRELVYVSAFHARGNFGDYGNFGVVFRRFDRYRAKIYRNLRLTDVSQVFMKSPLFATCRTIEQNLRVTAARSRGFMRHTHATQRNRVRIRNTMYFSRYKANLVHNLRKHSNALEHYWRLISMGSVVKVRISAYSRPRRDSTIYGRQETLTQETARTCNARDTENRSDAFANVYRVSTYYISHLVRTRRLTLCHFFFNRILLTSARRKYCSFLSHKFFFILLHFWR